MSDPGHFRPRGSLQRF